MDVLVTGADQRQGLAVIRTLGSKGLKVFAAGLEPKSLGFFSRYAAGFCQYPSPLSDKMRFVSTILEAVRQYSIPVVLPVVESTVIALDEYRSEFEGKAKLALPSSDSLLRALDKKETLTLAKTLDIPIPRSCFPASLDDALSFADNVGYPIAMKPRAHRSYIRVNGGASFKVAYARNSEELVKELRPFCQKNNYPILQEYCPGVKVNQGILYAGGETLGIYQYKGVREYPLTGGVTSVHMSVPIDPELKQWTVRLLEAMAWDGVAAVEYKVNQVTGKKVLMEVNGRFWAPLSAANKLGLNFPYALFRYISDGRKEKLPSDYPIGKRNRYIRGDIVALVNHWLGHTPDFLNPLPSKTKALWNFLSDFRPGVQFDVLDLRDPNPGFRELMSLFYVYSGARKILRYLSRGQSSNR
jgi:predicted ATP-grasp superfamily ATP-dependent carboligase